MLMQDYLAKLIMSQLTKQDPPELPDDISVQEVINIAGRNHMEYIVFSGLLHTEGVSEDIKALLRSRVKASVMRTLAQMNEAEALSQLYEKAGIKNQLLKGSVLKKLYPSPELREMSDIDILVDNERMEDIGSIMRNRSYHLVERVRQHDVYSRGPLLLVEAHSALYDKTVDSNQFEYFVSFKRAKLKDNNKYTYVFSNEDFYVYMMAHMAKHFYAQGCGIRNLVDVYVYLQNYGNSMDWDYVVSQLKECGIAEFTEHIENLAQRWLNCEEHDVFYDELFKYMLDCGIYGKSENGIWSRFSEQNQTLTGLKKALKKWYLFPPYDYMTKYYSWVEGRKWLMPVAWAARGIKGMFSKYSLKKREMIESVDDEHVATCSLIYRTMSLKFKK